MFRWLEKLIGGKMPYMEDLAKIQAKIRALNLSTPGQIWEQVDGYHALTKVDVNVNPAVFNPAAGVPIKAFFNRTTREIKLFPGFDFETDPNPDGQS